MVSPQAKRTGVGVLMEERGQGVTLGLPADP